MMRSMFTGSLWQDVRNGCRSMMRMPLVASVIVLSLAVGIGVNTAVFSWIQLFVFNPLPGVRGGGNLQLVEPRAETGSHPGTSWKEYLDLRERLTAFEGLVAIRSIPVNVGEAGRTERTYAQFVSENYFAVLGLTPALGRFPTPQEVAPSVGAGFAVISHDYWQAHMGGAADVVGRSLRINDRDVAIVGVTPRGFQGTILGLQFDLFLPSMLAPTIFPGTRELEDRSLRGYSMLGRLASGASAAQAQAELGAAMTDLARTYPETNATMTADVLPFWKAPRGPQGMFLNALLLLQGVLLLLLLAVCGNTANLLLARVSARQREIGVRLAIGASRGRIVRLLVAENLALALPGAALGVLIAAWGTQALRNVPIYTALPVKFQTSVDWMGLAFATVLAIACAIAFGAAPAAQLSRLDPHLALRLGARTAARSRLRQLLMATEVALATAVLIVAGLFLQSFQDTRDIDPGFRRDGVLLATYDIVGRDVEPAEAREFARRVLDELRSVPDVGSAALSTQLPLDIHGMPLRNFVVEGRARPDGRQDRALSNTVSPGYFDTMAIPFVAGSDFADLSDTTRPPQVVVNEEFVRRFLEGMPPVGRKVDARGGSFQIAGVVKDTTYESFGEPPKPMMYFSYRDRPSPMAEIHVLTRAGSETMVASHIRRIVRALNPTLPVYNVRTMTEHVETNLFLRRIPARMFAVLGPLLLALAAVGIYAVVAYSVAQRTTEIGVRLALGATPRRVVRQIILGSLNVVAIGAAVGWFLVWIVNAHINRGPLSLPAFVGVPLVLLTVATLACWIPARRAAATDPMLALRRE